MNIQHMMNKDNPVRFALVGCGYIGRRHAEVIRSTPNAYLTALCDSDPSKSGHFSGWNTPFFNRLEEMLDSDIEFDVLCIATPNGMHADQAVLGLKHGKHVVIEKPMALRKSDCERIISESLHASKKVFCVMQNRYSPPSVWLKEMIESGKLGKVYLVQINCYWNRDERYYGKDTWKGSATIDGGTLFTQFSHFVDMLYWLLGDIKDIQTKFMDFSHQNLTEFEDSGMVMFNLMNGGMGTITYSTSVWDRNMESTLTIIAENGSVKVGGQYMNKVEYCHVKDYELPELAPVNPPNDYGVYQGSASNHEHVYHNVIESLSSNGQITTNALEGMKVVEIIERIYLGNPYFNLKKQ